MVVNLALSFAVILSLAPPGADVGPSPRDAPVVAASVADAPAVPAPAPPPPLDMEAHRLLVALASGDATAAPGGGEAKLDALAIYESALWSSPPGSPHAALRLRLVRHALAVLGLDRPGARYNDMVKGLALLRAYRRVHAGDFYTPGLELGFAELDGIGQSATHALGEGDPERAVWRYERIRIKQILRSDTDLKRRYSVGRGLMVSGIPMIPAGLTFGLLFMSLGEAGVGIGIAGVLVGVAGLVFVPVGAVMYTRARREARDRLTAELATGPRVRWVAPLALAF